MAGSIVALSVDLANSLLTTVTWTANYATTADTFGTIGTPTKTQIATGTFTVTSAVTNYTTTISIPAAATTGIEILFTVGAQISGTWTIGNVQLEKNTGATGFDVRPYGTELALCQRYYEVNYGVIFRAQFASGFLYIWQPFKAEKRATPTMSLASTTYSNASGGGFNITTTSGSELYINASSSAGYLIANLISSSEL
jgi:hypothetical protein